MGTFYHNPLRGKPEEERLQTRQRARDRQRRRLLPDRGVSSEDRSVPDGFAMEETVPLAERLTRVSAQYGPPRTVVGGPPFTPKGLPAGATSSMAWQSVLPSAEGIDSVFADVGVFESGRGDDSIFDEDWWYAPGIVIG